MDPFFGEIKMVAFDYAPRNFAKCDGQLLDVAQNQLLFSLLMNTYGGDGQFTFALPDLRGRAPVHYGTGPGLSNRQLGEDGGKEKVTVPGVDAVTDVSTQDDPQPSVDKQTMMQGQQAEGQEQQVDNMQPYLAMNFIIALSGVYPSRS